MNIVHIAPNSTYNDYWGYQENLLPKYQKKLGHDVILITSVKRHENGLVVEGDTGDYILSDGVRVVRRRYNRIFTKLLTNVIASIHVKDILDEINPDLVFFHGLISCTIFEVIKYKKEHPHCLIVQDNHMDYNIGFKQKTIKQRIMRCWYRLINKKSSKYVEKIYGVTPWRKEYAKDFFQIPENKLDILIMGADDECMHLNQRNDIRNMIRNKYDIKKDEFLIVTGGKIDKKKKIDVLIRASLNLPKVKLLIFGSVAEDIKEEFRHLIEESNNVIMIGWVDSNEVYKYFYAADLVFFPGQHSVLWEQACASKVPCIFEKWPGMEHVNNGGNSDFVFPITVEVIQQKLSELIFTDKYYAMKSVTESDNTDVFLYSEIAKKSLECLEK